METALFSLEEYRFTRVNIDFSDSLSSRLNLDLQPYGKFFRDKLKYELVFEFFAKESLEGSNDEGKQVVHIVCKAIFRLSSEDIPEYFYANSIAIIFPYLRAFISTVSLQANIEPIMLPILNLSSLKEELREATTLL
ncbi:hypothetical protein [Porphyromonas endodontalis]